MQTICKIFLTFGDIIVTVFQIPGFAYDHQVKQNNAENPGEREEWTEKVRVH